MTSHAALAIALLTMGALLSTPGAADQSNPGVDYDYSAPRTATLYAGEVATHAYEFEFRVTPREGESAVRLEAGYRDPYGEGAFAPPTQLSYRQGDEEATTIGSVQGTTEVAAVEALAGGSYVLRVEASLPSHEEGSETTYLRLLARSPSSLASATGLIFEYAYAFTARSLPVVATDAASGVASDAAQLNGRLVDLGDYDPVDVWFEHGPTTTYGGRTLAQTMTDPGGYSTTLSGLTPETTYHYRAVAASESAVVYGEDVFFTTPATPTTPPPPPPLLPGPVSDLRLEDRTSASARLAWTAAADATGYQVYRDLEADAGPSPLATTANPLYEDTGLAADTTYYYRVRARNADGDGPLSNALPVTTLPPPDVEAPTVVQGLRVGQVTARTIALNWSAATDNVAVTSYRVYRNLSTPFEAGPDTFAGATGNPFFTDAGLTPNTTYYYRVRAVDAAGNLGPASATAQARTGPAQDETAPTIRAVQVRTGEDSTRLEWETDEVALCTVRLEGPTNATLDAGEGTAFRPSLGDPTPGDYEYVISCRDAATNVGTYRGRFVLTQAPPGEDPVVKSSADEETTRQVEEAAGVELKPGALYFVDTNGDGRADRVEDATGTLAGVNAAPAEGVFLVRAAGTGAYVVIEPATRQAHPATEQASKVVREDANAIAKKLVLEVAQKEGWIVFGTPDSNPGLPILAIRRGDGESVPLSFAWREGGTLRFMDDPGTTYTVTFDAAGAPVPPQEGRPVGMFLLIVVLLLAACGMVLVLALRKSRSTAG